MFFKKAYNFLKSFPLDDSSNRLKKCDIIFFCHDVDRGLTLHGKAYSPLIDSIRDFFEARGIICESVSHPFSQLTNEKAHGSPISVNRSYFFYFLIRKIFPQKFYYIFSKKFNIYKKIIRKTQATVIITTDSRTEMCSTARELGCMCIELLHGVSHTRLPLGWETADTRALPQGILSLSSQSTRVFSQLNKHQIEIKTIPHPFLKRFTGENSHNLPIEWEMRPADRSKFKKEILVSLMWGYAGDHGPNVELENVLENGLFYKDLSWAVKRTPNIFWRFRFHPLQLKARNSKKLIKYMNQFVSEHLNAEWEQASKFPLPSVALHCAANISMASGSCYDVAAMGLKSLMLCPTLQKGGVHENFFTDLVEEGYVFKAPPKREHILNWVENVEKTAPRLSNLQDNQAWEDAANWIIKLTKSTSKVPRK